MNCFCLEKSFFDLSPKTAMDMFFGITIGAPKHTCYLGRRIQIKLMYLNVILCDKNILKVLCQTFLLAEIHC